MRLIFLYSAVHEWILSIFSFYVSCLVILFAFCVWACKKLSCSCLSTCFCRSCFCVKFWYSISMFVVKCIYSGEFGSCHSADAYLYDVKKFCWMPLQLPLMQQSPAGHQTSILIMRPILFRPFTEYLLIQAVKLQHSFNLCLTSLTGSSLIIYSQ